MRRTLLIGSVFGALVACGCGDDESSAGETRQAAQPAETTDADSRLTGRKQ